MATQAVSKHVAVLERAGLVSRQRAAPAEPPGASAVIDMKKCLAAYLRLWDSRLDNVAEVLDRIKEGDVDDPRD